MSKAKQAYDAWQRSAVTTETKRVAYIRAVQHERDERGRTLADIAREVGVSETRISRLLTRAKGAE